MFIFFCILASTGFYLFWVAPRCTVPVLTYHSIGDDKGLLSVSAENFERQMRYFKEANYRVITLDELVKGIESGGRFPRKTVVITFDDGFKDNFTYAYPVLRRYGFPATVFLVTDWIGADKEYLSWEEVVEMSKNNITFGGHTKSHAYLPAIVNKDILRKEIAGSKKVIEEHTGLSEPVYFCYPRGGFTEEVQMLVKEAGYDGACATNRGYDLLNRSDLYAINRVSIRDMNPYYSISNLFGAINFRVKVSGYYNIFRSKKGPY
jgi:peptidoglycan/xylan/chitin deacetylase (PgdA/CDA1 family)